jgi:hypothetical protein
VDGHPEVSGDKGQMKDYIHQLLDDIQLATEHITFPFADQPQSVHDWLSPKEEDSIAPIRNLEEWTGISTDMLPPSEMLTEKDIHQLLESLKKLLSACNCEFVLQTVVPERIQCETIRQNFNQDVKVRQWHMGFFELCKPGTVHETCPLGQHCQCAFYTDLFKDMVHEELTPEEERARELEIEVQHIKRKYGDDWMKYYPYHLDPEYDDEHGNPYNYGIDTDEDEGDDNWWRN